MPSEPMWPASYDPLHATFESPLTRQCSEGSAPCSAILALPSRQGDAAKQEDAGMIGSAAEVDLVSRQRLAGH
jgi:hypothetical protein